MLYQLSYVRAGSNDSAFPGQPEGPAVAGPSVAGWGFRLVLS